MGKMMKMSKHPKLLSKPRVDSPHQSLACICVNDFPCRLHSNIKLFHVIPNDVFTVINTQALAIQKSQNMEFTNLSPYTL